MWQRCSARRLPPRRKSRPSWHPRTPAFQAYLQYVAAKARAQGVSEGTLQRMLGDLTPNDRVIALDRDNVASGGAVSGFPPLAPYLRDHNTSGQIERGRAVYARLRPLAATMRPVMACRCRSPSPSAGMRAATAPTVAISTWRARSRPWRGKGAGGRCSKAS